MKIQEIREIIKLVDGSSIEEFSYEFEGVKVKMKKNGSGNARQTGSSSVQAPQALKTVEAPSAPAPTKESEAERLVSQETPEIPVDNDSEYHKILSPMVGTFYESPTPDEAAYVQPGTKVTSDQVVCIVEAMKLFNEIEAEVDGEIAEILVKDGQLVEYGQPLFLVKAN
ncbi:acetyl-CoA carboxylase biotin carboxyl carrier protein subunit [Planococcus antarcticus DSM 14505]|uniref:Biotin carboxyl carrier protein of acetyl-CoA carboxylase n=1 Tax=Planococcus antarcticus DSM 14505 TaxID=1185653 RepID=A0A1C7DLC8_9BACL|nr:acetyl-CoA carboxylase biotin carboxyl carrier protein [Planococcus antarcticus]ANU12237.1 acetyl-CoA carboxylase, biotin carboxyl carrier protein [Planococcus antarcticus DSM 14505]EIM06172.1 acetyl-CoA carboxylase biotin carboxyl carrier protein subunit [Planococcus antarcticus DSM 14505]